MQNRITTDHVNKRLNIHQSLSAAKDDEAKIIARDSFHCGPWAKMKRREWHLL